MTTHSLNCPNCGYALPTTSRPNELLKCPACNSTLFISDWKVGDANTKVVVPTPSRIYTVTHLLFRDDLCNVYQCSFESEGKTWQAMFRLTRDAADNDLVQNEARILSHLQSTQNYTEYRAFVPLLMESFLYQDAGASGSAQVNISVCMSMSPHRPSCTHWKKSIVTTPAASIQKTWRGCGGDCSIFSVLFMPTR
ncbi:MAG: hypothetical protein U0670_23450 [Anaerolineae bacterium]